VTNGFLDDIPVADVKRFQAELLQYMESRHPEIGRGIAESGKLADDAAEQLAIAVRDFRSSFASSQGVTPKEASAAPLTEEEQETMKKFRRPTAEEFEAKAGPAADSDVQLPG
jgi:F-type H+/Na+-transporting ATPase subunit alpha